MPIRKISAPVEFKSDILAWLRNYREQADSPGMAYIADKCNEAADEVERLRAALEPFAAWAEALDRDFSDHADDVIAGGLAGHCEVTFGDIRRARDLLK